MPEEYVGDHGHECMMMFFRAPVAESPRRFISLPEILDPRPAHTCGFHLPAVRRLRVFGGHHGISLLDFSELKCDVSVPYRI